MSTHSRRRWWMLVGAATAAVAWVSCGGEGSEGRVDSTGGEVCLADQSVCFLVDPGGLDDSAVVRIARGGEGPAAALSPVWDISFSSFTSDAGPTFLKPATVSFSFDLIDAGDVPSENLLRLYTVEAGEWVALSSPVVDRVRGRVRGQVSHLSPFVVLRADRLPDGGLPVQPDAGPPDASVVVPPPDAGRPDAGPPDAGRPDAGVPDAGAPDAGRPDAGVPDAGAPDAGRPDAGPPDAGPPDAGPPDAGPPDAGPPDAGPPDAGPPDAGPPDAGTPDAGTPDAGPPDAGPPDAGDAG